MLGRNRQEPESLPTFDSYQAPPVVPQPPAAPEAASFDSLHIPPFTSPQQVSSPEAIELLKRLKREQAESVDNYARNVTERALFLQHPSLTTQQLAGRRPGAPQIGANDRRAIGARYRAAIDSGQAGRPQLPPAREQPSPQRRPDVTPPQSKSDNKVPAPKSQVETVEKKSFLGAWAHENLGGAKRTRTLSVMAGVVALASAGIFGATHRSGSEGELATAVVTEKAPTEYKNDTFSHGTTLAQVKFTTGENTEVHVPVELKTPAHEAYVSIPIKQFYLSGMAIKASGVSLANNGGRAIWAKKDKNDIYQIDRSALGLYVEPWTKALGKTEAQSLARISSLLLPPVTNLPLYVDGAAADPKKYPLSEKGLSQLSQVIDTTNPKTPKFSASAIRTIAAELQLATIINLEDPNQCPSVQDALDSANKANLSAQKNVPANKTTINSQTEYGKASVAFASTPAIKAAYKKNATVIAATKEKDSNKKAQALSQAWATADLPLNGFAISCEAVPNIPKETQPTSSTTPTPSPTPTKKK